MSSLLISTRDLDKQEVSYREAVLSGLAPDGGLYVPINYPVIDTKFIKDLYQKPYSEIFIKIKALFVGDDIPSQKQVEIADKAFTADKFTSKSGNITPLREISKDLWIENLSLGLTAAFKDMALQPLAQEVNYFLNKKQKKMVILGATSGDTGSAAEAAFKGLETVGVIMLSPEVGMSAFQAAQMLQLSGGNIANLSVKGNFDDCQALVKKLKKDPELSGLGAVNSINWGRVTSQIPYYVSGYLQAVLGDTSKQVDFVVPTGNFGNILAGSIAKNMGLPIRRLIVATNENNVLDRLIQTGVYSYRPSVITSSPSMDISQASNYERLLFDILGRDPEKVIKYMNNFQESREVDFKDFGLPSDVIKRLGLDSSSSKHADRLESIKWVYQQSGLVIDPHTADALTVARQKYEPGVPIICMSTALPVKFEPTVKEALGFIPPRDKRFENLEKKTKGNFLSIDNDEKVLKNVIEEFAIGLNMQGYLAS